MSNFVFNTKDKEGNKVRVFAYDNYFSRREYGYKIEGEDRVYTKDELDRRLKQ